MKFFTARRCLLSSFGRGSFLLNRPTNQVAPFRRALLAQVRGYPTLLRKIRWLDPQAVKRSGYLYRQTVVAAAQDL